MGSILVHWGPLGVCWSQILGSNPLRVHWSQLLVGAWWLCGGGSLEVCYLFVRFLLGLLCGLALLSKNCIFCILIKVKFGFSEKHIKFEKNLPLGADKTADLLCKRQNHEEDFFFFKLCVLLKKSEL